MTFSPLRPLTAVSRNLALSIALACAPALASAQADSAPAPATASAAEQVVAVSELSSIPAPTVPAKAWLTLDVNSGQIVGANNPDQQVEPASLTKLMSAYVVFEAIKAGRLSLDQEVTVSEKAWRTEGSRMFINVNSRVSVDELLQGLIVQSGNDATVALAEAVAGSEAAFVALMNEEAQRQGLANTHYTNSPGLPDPQHMTTVRDLATLAANLVADFPEFLHYYSQKEFTYNKIKQPNRNRLLWADPTVDGLKTGHTSSAGYCLVSTALRDGRRVVSVLVGADSDAARTEASLKLLNWSYQNFDTIKLFDQGQPAVQARVWEGEAETVDLGQTTPIWITVPRGKGPEVKPIARYTQPLIAPLAKGSEVGTVSLSLDGKVLREEPLAVMNDVAQAGFFGRMYDKIRLMLQ
ncbi:D-alanyl-D-alanine carboxypeptidase family protein [Pusillimonas noertemannii]|uniref:serine-type D-Ala-D-Ala carboxypeptidase n=1 Tax=Pusillimonas noertemannii TaxID=305977 RepID=A0A2U1CIM3_9BURK|nr:D-alanyl-D-alanine carboxypeptidase family protein [Pusillimonas noertemannii]NYT70691.1 D-alanyl-D-alanine carboxypeptidase [Pusillimonas noertemannii]PVY60848.1 penicillin-binding protein 6 [Pusillimonas noertemannii]TFL08553.1 D-alanyl-D-alanine carboxypeptidase [Pusillimonas noertemannii]